MEEDRPNITVALWFPAVFTRLNPACGTSFLILGSRFGSIHQSIRRHQTRQMPRATVMLSKTTANRRHLETFRGGDPFTGGISTQEIACRLFCPDPWRRRSETNATNYTSRGFSTFLCQINLSQSRNLAGIPTAERAESDLLSRNRDRDLNMGFDQQHEPLSGKTRTFARMITSLIEEAEAIG
jgi:hypothetical protein